MPFLVEGESSVSRIAEQSGIDIAIIKMVVQHLVYFRLVHLIDLFKFSNVYCARSKLAELVYTPSRQRKYLKYLQANVNFEEPGVMTPILQNLPPIKLSSFLSCLTDCERQACTV